MTKASSSAAGGGGPGGARAAAAAPIQVSAQTNTHMDLSSVFIHSFPINVLDRPAFSPFLPGAGASAMLVHRQGVSTNSHFTCNRQHTSLGPLVTRRGVGRQRAAAPPPLHPPHARWGQVAALARPPAAPDFGPPIGKRERKRPQEPRQQHQAGGIRPNQEQRLSKVTRPRGGPTAPLEPLIPPPPAAL